MAKIYICDGNSLLFRCFYATFRPGVPVMRSKAGVPTNAIFTFSKMLQTLTSKLTPEDRFIVCFDTGHKTFRSKEIEAYKAQRKPIEPDLKAQIPLAHEMLDAMNIEHAEMEGYEGDDVAGSLAKYAEKQGDKVILFTSDKDFLQLIDDNIEVHSLRKGLSDICVYNKDNMKELFGCRADQVVDFKAIAGDPSDNYKGIPHVGETSAFKLLNQFNHLSDILAFYKGKSDSALARNINAGAKEGLLCQKIATILTNLDVKKFYDDSKLKPINKDALIDFYKKYDLNSLIKGLEKQNKVEAVEGQKEPAQMNLEDTLDKPSKVMPFQAINDISNQEMVGASIILDGTNENVSPILGVALVDHNQKLYVIEKDNLKNAKNFIDWISSSLLKDSLDSKSLIVALNRLDIQAKGFGFDMLLASYLVNSDSAKDLEDSFHQLKIALPENPVEKITTASYLMETHKEEILQKIRNQDALLLLNDVELPLANALAHIEIEGMPLDLATLSVIGAEYKKRLKDLESQIFDLAGKEFNIKSPKQVADILFNQLGLQRGKKETGTSVEVLNNHYYDHPIVPLILDYRTYSKIISGYIEALPKHLQKDDKIHAIINQTLTSTGRLSMSEPNLQNISIRKEEGKEIRKAFFYKEDKVEFLSLDYSQIELRVLASLGNIKNLIEVCNSGEDIHKATASKVFNVPISEVTDDMRRKAKTVNFGIVYGISIFGLKERLGISYSEAKQIIEQFKKTFDGLEDYEKTQIDFAHKYGYVKTILNRRRYFPDINSDNRMLRSFSERAAVNATIQGSAADLIKVAMNKVFDLLKGKKSKIILQIHDELVFKMYKEEEAELIPLISKTMDSALPLKVRLSVDGHTGKTWFDCK